MRRTFRKIDIHVCVRLDGVVDDFCVRTFARRRPNRETESGAGLEDTKRFGTGVFRIGEMEQGEVGQNTIEARVGKRKILRVTLTKFDVRKHFLGDRYHLSGDMETGWTRAG